MSWKLTNHQSIPPPPAPRLFNLHLIQSLSFGNQSQTCQLHAGVPETGATRAKTDAAEAIFGLNVFLLNALIRQN